MYHILTQVTPRYTIIVKLALESAKVASELIKDIFPHNFLYVWKILAFIANEYTINAVDTIIGQVRA